MKDSTKWLYFGVAFVLSTLQFGLVFAFGALFPVLRDKFLADRPTTAAVQSLLMGVATCFSSFSGILINKLGLHVTMFLSSICVSSGFIISFFMTKIWYLFFTISILAGLGMSQLYLISLTLVATIQNQKQKSLGVAIHSTCVPVAGLIYPHLLDWLTSSYGLSGTFLVLGGIFCNSYVFALMIWLRRSEFVTYKKEKGTTVANEKYAGKTSEKSNVGRLCRRVKNFIKKLITVRFVSLLAATAVSMTALNGYLDVVFDISDWKGFNEIRTRNVFVIFNIFAILFSLLPGLMKQKLDIDTYFYPFGLSLLGLIGSLVIRYSKTFILYAVGTAFMGAIPGVLSSAFIICTQLVRLEQISVGIGMFDTVMGFLSAGIGPLYGAIRDNTGSYNDVFPIITAAQGFAAMLFIGDIILRKICRNSDEDENEA